MLTVEHLSGGYQHLQILKDVSFTVNDGEVVGLIGLNGAGKSTTIKHILGLLQATSGTVKINDVSLQSDLQAYRQQIAFVPETPILYPELTLREHLEMTIMAYQLDSAATWSVAEKLLKLFRLDQMLDWFPTHFSKGMQQKVMIVNAFMTPANLLIIDEPFTGLDPLAVHNLLDLIATKKAAGKSVLMTTHILATAKAQADRFILLNQGTIRAAGTVSELAAEFKVAPNQLDDIYLQMAKENGDV
ncbi:ABC transporter ATP-binding protein [Lapidilactobacillus wuchangensis]|uniref:ABC transporter ATP-binding protein n=1 Tax=Lapidilactobacillus wuchangensis TaxID=2486001 RepID=UPI000F78AA7F|nr:ABC transporter ATP-binding protein [Lapidilactobacillus wuchangensis]